MVKEENEVCCLCHVGSQVVPLVQAARRVDDDFPGVLNHLGDGTKHTFMDL